MKTTLKLLILFLSFGSFAQITLEHTYENSHITRVKLELSGEKYYGFDSKTKQLSLYNSDHTPWKSISLSTSSSDSNFIIKNISEIKINSDQNLEIVYEFYDLGVHYSRIINENGIILLNLPNTYQIRLDEQPGLENKIIAYKSIYSIPSLSLENTYDSYIYRINLENYGEKYYLLDDVTQQAKFYNSNHSLWKTVSTPVPPNFGNYHYSLYGISVVSDSRNPDSVLEFAYSYGYSTGSGLSVPTIKFINEFGTALLTTNGNSFKFFTTQNHEKKLICNYMPMDKTLNSVYSLPSLKLEHDYGKEIGIVQLENSGLKYYLVTGGYTATGNNYQLEMYNEDHTLWKSIPLSVPNSYSLVKVNHVSQNKLNTDNLVEISYTFSKYIGYINGDPTTTEQFYESKIINELGSEMIDIHSASTMCFSEIAGLNNKFIADIDFYSYYSSDLSWQKGNVYSLESLGTISFNNKPKVLISPNPANSFLNINSLASQIKEAAIYNTIGTLIKREMAQNIIKIDVNELPTGIYIVNLTDFNNVKSTHKITISH